MHALQSILITTRGVVSINETQISESNGHWILLTNNITADNLSKIDRHLRTHKIIKHVNHRTPYRVKKADEGISTALANAWINQNEGYTAPISENVNAWTKPPTITTKSSKSQARNDDKSVITIGTTSTDNERYEQLLLQVNDLKMALEQTTETLAQTNETHRKQIAALQKQQERSTDMHNELASTVKNHDIQFTTITKTLTQVETNQTKLASTIKEELSTTNNNQQRLESNQNRLESTMQVEFQQMKTFFTNLLTHTIPTMQPQPHTTVTTNTPTANILHNNINTLHNHTTHLTSTSSSQESTKRPRENITASPDHKNPRTRTPQEDLTAPTQLFATEMNHPETPPRQDNTSIGTSPETPPRQDHTLTGNHQQSKC